MVVASAAARGESWHRGMGLVSVLAFVDQRLHLEWHAPRACYLDGASWRRWIQSVTCMQLFGQVMEDSVARLRVRASRGEVGGFVTRTMAAMWPLIERRPPRLVAVRAGGVVLQIQTELRLVFALDWVS